MKFFDKIKTWGAKINAISIPANKLRNIIMFMTIALLLVLCFTLFKNNMSNTDKIIAAKDATITAIQEKRATDSLLLIEKDKTIRLRQSRDSLSRAYDALLVKQINTNKNEHSTNEKEYDEVPGNIDSADKSKLREFITNF